VWAERDRTGRASSWPELRALLIFIAILISLVDGFPLPRMAPHHLRDPMNQRELARWSGYLEGLGVELSPEALGARVVEASVRLEAARRRALAPVQPALDALQLRQRFALFPIAKKRLLWFEIVGRRRGAERDVILFRPGDDAHSPPPELAPLRALEHRKVRALWNAGSTGPNAELAGFSTWVAEALFRNDADLETVRVGYRWLELPAPGEPARAPGARVFAITVHR
jgi:hypothetical protein